MSESYELSRTECESLLRAGVAGRIAVVAPDGPHLLPINYSVVDEAIVVRTSPYSLLGTHGRVRTPLPRGTAWRGWRAESSGSRASTSAGSWSSPTGRPHAFYRETVAGPRTASQPCFLAVRFRLRYVRGLAHPLFKMESILNTPLWLAHDDRGMCRGLDECDGADRAERYAQSLWRVLEIVSEPDSIDYRVMPDLRRDEALDNPGRPDGRSDEAWWRVISLTEHRPVEAI